MSNFFDQFDEQKPGAQAAGKNFFDQFDGSTPAPQPQQPPQIDPITIRGHRLMPGQQRLPLSNQQVLQNGADLLSAISHGASFGQDTKAAAALPAALNWAGNKIIGQPTNFQEDYQSRLAQEQADYEAAKKRGSLRMMLGELGGSIKSPITEGIGYLANKAFPIANGVASRFANIGTQGGAVNSLYQATLGDEDKAKQSAAGTAGVAGLGMTSQEGGWEKALNVAKDFGKGAVTAAAPVALAEGGSKILTSILSPLIERIAPDQESLARIARAMEEDGLTPDMLASKLSKRGDQAMLADVSPGMTKLAEDTAQFKGEPRTMAARQLFARQGGRFSAAGGASGRVQDALQEGLVDPAIEKVQSALGTTLVHNTSKDVASNLINTLDTEAKPIWKDLFSEPKVPDAPELDAMLKRPVIQKAMNIGKETAQDIAAGQGSIIPDDMFIKDGKPTLQAWHAAKEGIDDLLFTNEGNAYKDPLTGEWSKAGKGLDSMRKSILSVTKAQFPEYENALNKWSGPMQALEAMQSGARVARGDARVTSDMIDNLSDSGKQFFRIGLGDQAQYLASKTPTTGNPVAAILKNQNDVRNLQQVFESRADFNKFRQQMMAVNEQYNTLNQVLKGSPTASREAGMAEQGKEIGKAVLEGAKEGGAEGAAIQGGKAGAKALWGAIAQPEAMRSQLGAKLFTRNPEEKAAVLEKLRELQAKGTIFAQPGMGFLPRTAILASKTPFSFGGQ